MLPRNILIVDDHLVVRKGVELILKEKFNDATIHSVQNYDEALEVLKAIKIDVVLLDININGVENIKIMGEIKRIQSHTKILIFTSHDERQYGMRYLQQGADGYLNKFCSEELLTEAIFFLIENGYYYSNFLKAKVEDKSGKISDENPISRLSNREYEIAKLLINGYGNLEISNKLNIKMTTVSTYKNRVFEKLNINNIVALAAIFNQE
jgi:DNA-binding NarL/FixJ family response regulator